MTSKWLFLVYVCSFIVRHSSVHLKETLCDFRENLQCSERVFKMRADSNMSVCVCVSGLLCASGCEMCQTGQAGDSAAAPGESGTGSARHQPASSRPPEHHRVFTALLPGFTPHSVLIHIETLWWFNSFIQPQTKILSSLNLQLYTWLHFLSLTH